MALHFLIFSAARQIRRRRFLIFREFKISRFLPKANRTPLKLLDFQKLRMIFSHLDAVSRHFRENYANIRCLFANFVPLLPDENCKATFFQWSQTGFGFSGRPGALVRCGLFPPQTVITS